MLCPFDSPSTSHSERPLRAAVQVLIFSQMTRMLDILEDYCVWSGYSFRRLDGTVAATDRMQAMKEFQESEEGIDIFLLSTRAGGLGVNLTRADTVIIFDSDW